MDIFEEFPLKKIAAFLGEDPKDLETKIRNQAAFTNLKSFIRYKKPHRNYVAQLYVNQNNTSFVDELGNLKYREKNKIEKVCGSLFFLKEDEDNFEEGFPVNQVIRAYAGYLAFEEPYENLFNYEDKIIFDPEKVTFIEIGAKKPKEALEWLQKNVKGYSHLKEMF